MLSPTKARAKLATKAGKNTGTPYYAVGIEVPPRRGSTFSMRYTEVSSARAGRKFLRKRILRKRVGMVGKLVLFNETGTHKVVLQTIVREKGNSLHIVNGAYRVRRRNG